MNMSSGELRALADLDDFHRVDTFRWLLSNEAADASVLYFQTGMLLTGQLQQMHKILIDKDILLVQKYPK